MEIRNHATNMQMHPALMDALKMCRKQRGFNVDGVVEAKVKLLNDYYRQAGLKSAVVAVSGGLDSAVVLGLVAMASRMVDSPIERIVAVTMPAVLSQGVTGQDNAARLARQVCERFEVEPFRIDIGPIVKSITEAVEDQLGHPGLRENIGTADPKPIWARGQAVSYARTPTYYYVTSVLSAQGQPGLVIGTTNLSEGGYLGYFGKASDGMVDVQLISDLFKNEVYAIADFLDVPREVLERAPTGDMFDATTDEVVFGAPYDFVELFTHMKWDVNCRVMTEMYVQESDDAVAAKAQLDEYTDNLERMHSYNAHKYLGRSPAVHLDILRSGVKTGWDNPAWRAA